MNWADLIIPHFQPTNLIKLKFVSHVLSYAYLLDHSAQVDHLKA